MKLCVISDLHADWHTDGYERLSDVEEVLEAAGQHCVQLKNKGEQVAFVALGDYTNPGSRNVHRSLGLMSSIAMKLGCYRIYNYWLIGNHDVIEDGHGSHVLLALQCMQLDYTRVVSEPCVEPITFAGTDEQAVRGAMWLPYVAASSPAVYEPEDWAKEQKLKPDFVFGHLSIPGILYEGSETHEMPRGRAMRFPLDWAAKQKGIRCFNGHYHTRQVFHGPPPITIPGSAVRLTHGEEKNPTGYLMVDVP